MRKNVFSSVLFILFVFLLVPLPAFAAPEVHDFLSVEGMKNVKTVLVMPVTVPKSVSDPSISDAIKTKWAELVLAKQKTAAYKLITPKQLLERHRSTTGARVKTQVSEAALAHQAMSLAPRYADAVLSLNIIKCDYAGVRHTQKFEDKLSFEEKYEWEEGKWVVKNEPVEDRELKPAWTERFIDVDMRLELWSTKKEQNALIYSCQVTEHESERAYNGKLPLLTDIAPQCMGIAMKRLPVK